MVSASKPDPLATVAHMIQNATPAIYQHDMVDRSGMLRVIELFHHQVFRSLHPLTPHIITPWGSMGSLDGSYLIDHPECRTRHIRTHSITTPRYRFDNSILFIRYVLSEVQRDIVGWLAERDSPVLFEGPGLMLFREAYQDQLWLYGNVWERSG